MRSKEADTRNQNETSQPPHHYCFTHNAGVDRDNELDEDVLEEVVSLKRFLYGQDNEATLVEGR